MYESIGCNTAQLYRLIEAVSRNVEHVDRQVLEAIVRASSRCGSPKAVIDIVRKTTEIVCM